MTRDHAFWGSDPSGYCACLDCSRPFDDEAGGRADGGRFYAWDTTTLNRAAEHGCLTEDVDTGDPLVCGQCGGVV